jgi:hypothetical protein
MWFMANGLTQFCWHKKLAEKLRTKSQKAMSQDLRPAAIFQLPKSFDVSILVMPSPPALSAISSL